MRSIQVPAGVIDYDEAGSGPPVVLLHGLLMDHTLWDRVLPLLPGGFRYLRPVLPLGAHRRALNPGTDLTLPGQVRLVADLQQVNGVWKISDVTVLEGATPASTGSSSGSAGSNVPGQ